MNFWGQPALVKLRPWQEPHVEALAGIIERHGAAADLSDTGTGKTFSAVGLAKRLNRRLFVIGPKTSARRWLETAVKMQAPFLFSGGWEECKTKRFPWNRFYADPRIPGRRRLEWVVPKDALLVFDEAHRAKGRSTLNSMLLQGARGIPTLILSASLAEEAREMYASGMVLGLHNGTSADFKAFVDNYGGKQQALNSLLFPEHAQRLRTSEIPGFPLNHIIPQLVSVSQSDKFSAWRAEVNARAEELAAEERHADALTVRLRYRQAAEMARLPASLELARDLYAEGKSVVMFFAFRETLFHAARVIGSSAVQLYGNMPKGHAERAIEEFQANRKPFCLVTHGAGSEAISLHDLNGRPRASIISPPEHAVQLFQALGRIHRDGSLSPATQYIPFMEGVEEEVYNNVTRKMENIKTLHDGDLK